MRSKTIKFKILKSPHRIPSSHNLRVQTLSVDKITSPDWLMPISLIPQGNNFYLHDIIEHFTVLEYIPNLHPFLSEIVASGFFETTRAIESSVNPLLDIEEIYYQLRIGVVNRFYPEIDNAYKHREFISKYLKHVLNVNFSLIPDEYLVNLPKNINYTDLNIIEYKNHPEIDRLVQLYYVGNNLATISKVVDFVSGVRSLSHTLSEKILSKYNLANNQIPKKVSVEIFRNSEDYSYREMGGYYVYRDPVKNRIPISYKNIKHISILDRSICQDILEIQKPF